MLCAKKMGKIDRGRQKWENVTFPYRESNPGRVGENHES